MVSRYKTSFKANLRVLNLKMTLLFLGLLPFLLYRNTSFLEKSIFFYLCSVFMILTDDYISQSKIVETSQFIFKPTNIGLLIEKCYFCNNNQTLSL